MASRHTWTLRDSARAGKLVAFACAISAGVHAGLSGGIIQQFPSRFS